jgi:hypothetical protein
MDPLGRVDPDRHWAVRVEASTETSAVPVRPQQTSAGASAPWVEVDPTPVSAAAFTDRAPRQGTFGPASTAKARPLLRGAVPGEISGCTCAFLAGPTRT